MVAMAATSAESVDDAWFDPSGVGNR
jgi:hypothetical protein